MWGLPVLQTRKTKLGMFGQVFHNLKKDVPKYGIEQSVLYLIPSAMLLAIHFHIKFFAM